jgi:hypothetical protein
MPLILPHRITIQRHASVPYLWRATCLCKWSALAPSQERIKMAASEHISEEVAFPDWSFLSDKPEPFA